MIIPPVNNNITLPLTDRKEYGRGPHNQTALHWACWYGWRDTVAALLARGAEVNLVENQFGATPLGWAEHGSENSGNEEGDYEEVMRLLRAAGGREGPETL